MSASTFLPPVVETFPKELTAIHQWVAWMAAPNPKKEKPDKVPVNPKNGNCASTTNSKTWGTIEQALAFYRGKMEKTHTIRTKGGDRAGPVCGVGFVLTDEDAFIGIDVDNCRGADGSMPAWVQEIVERVGSYTEVSPSGTGLRIFVKGTQPCPGFKNTGKNLEVYKSGRYLTVTGRALKQQPIIENQAALDWIYATYGSNAQKKTVPTYPTTSAASVTGEDDDNALIKKILMSKSGEKCKRLFVDGDISAYKDDHSAADMALCNILALWCRKDPVQMNRLFRKSGLYRPKWDERRGALTYGERTIQVAIDGTTEVYQERRQDKPFQPETLSPQIVSKSLTKGSPEDERPLITWNEAQLPDIVKGAEDAIIAANNSGSVAPIYQRGSSLVRIGKSLSLPKQGMSRSPDAPQIFPVGAHFLQSHLTDIITWSKWNERKQSLVPCACPKKVPDTLLDMAGKYRVQPLIGIVNAPTLRPDHSILEEEGYDADTGLYCDFGGVQYPPIPQAPTRQNAEQAAALLLDVISEFPFKTEADRSVAFAFILTALVRRSLPTAPGFAISATVMATGKTRLANLASHIAYGHSADNISYTTDEAEMHKRVFSLLMEGAGVVVLDNLEQPLAGETLCTVLTEPNYKGRTLGKSQMESVSTNVTWAATGNNLTMKGDITTRFLLCQMDAQVERPEERTFKRNLDQYIPAHRAELVAAGLTLLRAFSLSTAKPQLVPYGRFEAWSDLVREAVVWVGLPDPLGTRKEIDANDPVRDSLKAVLTAWHEVFREKPVLIKDVISSDSSSADLVDALEGAVICRGGLNAKAVGRWLSKHKERRIDGLRAVQLSTDVKGSVWKVAKD